MINVDEYVIDWINGANNVENEEEKYSAFAYIGWFVEH